MAEEQKKADAERSSTRITVTLPRNDYEHICRIADAKRVSASWVVRDAVNAYVNNDMPLFAEDAHGKTRG